MLQQPATADDATDADVNAIDEVAHNYANSVAIIFPSFSSQADSSCTSCPHSPSFTQPLRHFLLRHPLPFLNPV